MSVAAYTFMARSFVCRRYRSLRSSSTRRRSWPQAPSMSAPISRRTVAEMRRASRRRKKLLNVRARGRVQVALAHGVEGDEVDVAAQAAQARGQFVGVAQFAVDALDQRVFKNDAAAGLFDIFAGGGKHVLDGVGVGHGQKLFAHLVVGGVQGDGERHRQALLWRRSRICGDEPAGGERYVAQGDVRALRGIDQAQKLHRVFVVVQRFAAAHEHDVVHAPPFRGEHAVHRGRPAPASPPPSGRARGRSSVEAQKRQPMRQPTCVERQRVSP